MYSVNLNVVLTLIVCGLVAGCGNTQFSHEPNPVTPQSAAEAPSGLLLKVTNALPLEQIGENRVRPHLNAYFCSPHPKDSETKSPLTRCRLLPGIIRNGTTETFLVSADQLAAVYSEGGGYASFEFSDNQQLTSVPWFCASPNIKVALKSNLKVRQDWEVTVNQRFAISYGCLINSR